MTAIIPAITRAQLADTTSGREGALLVGTDTKANLGSATTVEAALEFLNTSFATASTGVDWKESVRAATTGNITLSGAQTIDGVSVIAGDRVLVKAQSTGADNGIYVCAAGAWSRATDANTSAEVTGGMAVVVNEGSTLADTLWICSTNDAITLGSTALVFTQLGSGGGGGTVTSVGASSPLASSGGTTPNISISDQSANVILAGPTAGGAAAPTFRALVAADIPNLAAGSITTGQLALARGGTGVDLSGTGAGFLRQATTGATVTVSAIVAGDLPNHSAALITTGQIALARGGTGVDLSATGAGFLRQATTGATVTVSTLVAADIPNLAASIITSGTFNTARLGSGTADNTTFLRGDSTFQTVQAVSPTIYSETDGGTITFTLSNSLSQKVTIAANRTLAVSNDTGNVIFDIQIKQDGTGSRTVTWWSGIEWAGGVAPTLTTAANKRDWFGFRRTGSGTYEGVVLGANI